MPQGKSLGNFKEYREELKQRSFARAERFEVEFNIENLVQKNDDLIDWRTKDSVALTKDVVLFCEEVQIPGMILSNKEYNVGPWTFFRNTKVGFLGNEINFTFLTDQDWFLRSFFEHWVNACADTVSQEIGYPDDVTTTITIKALDVQDNVKKEWTLYEAMPKVINLVPLSSGTVSAVRNTLIISSAYWDSSEVYGPYESDMEAKMVLSNGYKEANSTYHMVTDGSGKTFFEPSKEGHYEKEPNSEDKTSEINPGQGRKLTRTGGKYLPAFNSDD